MAFKGDLGGEISVQKDSPVNYGSEFRDTAALAKLFFYHKYRTNIINIIQQGCRYHLDPIEEGKRKSYLDAMIIRGNHKSSHSEMNSYALDKAISKYIDHRWALPLTIESLQNIKNTGVVPLGVAEQLSINKKGEHYIKRRVTRDFSFPSSSGISVKNRVQQESLQPYFYGFCLLSILHVISVMQSKWPTKIILIGKTYMEAAYRQIHANATTFLTCIAILDELAFLGLRLPFGATPAPAEYMTVSEVSIDLGNDLLRDEYWYTEDLNSPHQSLLP